VATFSITPNSGYPLPPSDSFPQFIQFQSAGVDLGDPDVDTVNFAAGNATRGTGENAGVVTVTSTGGSGGFTPFVVQLSYAYTGGQGQFVTVNFSASTVLQTSAEITWDGSGYIATFVNAGVYRLRFSHKITTTVNWVESINVETDSLSIVDQYVEILTPYDNIGGYSGVLVREYSQTLAGITAGETTDFAMFIQTISGNDVEHFNLLLEIEIQRLS
jgi:hypothetical protein